MTLSLFRGIAPSHCGLITTVATVAMVAIVATMAIMASGAAARLLTPPRLLPSGRVEWGIGGQSRVDLFGRDFGRRASTAYI